MNATAMKLHLIDGLEKELNVDRRHDPEAEIERLGNIMRRAAAKYEQCRADTRKGLKETLAGLTADRKALKAQFDADMAMLREREATAREQAKRDIAAYSDGIASSKAALAALSE